MKIYLNLMNTNNKTSKIPPIQLDAKSWTEVRTVLKDQKIIIGITKLMYE